MKSEVPTIVGGVSTIDASGLLYWGWGEPTNPSTGSLEARLMVGIWYTSIQGASLEEEGGGCPRLMLVAYCVGVGVNQPVH